MPPIVLRLKKKSPAAQITVVIMTVNEGRYGAASVSFERFMTRILILARIAAIITNVTANMIVLAFLSPDCINS
tara:strand:- start:11559 stop:11780 length:222 start_codon:yes stop_codon:yes gene_type:complete